jgi:Cu/Ag efflux pump CusA
MKKFLALGYMLALPLVSGAKILPSVMFLLFFTTTTTPAGILSLMGAPAAVFGAVFDYFVRGFFPTTAISNWIMGL